MQEFPYPINIIPITFYIIKEIENNLNQNLKSIELQFILNLPPEVNTNSNTPKNINQSNNNYIINLLKNQIINKIEKLYKVKVNLSIKKNKENQDILILLIN